LVNLIEIYKFEFESKKEMITGTSA